MGQKLLITHQNETDLYQQNENEEDYGCEGTIEIE